MRWDDDGVDHAVERRSDAWAVTDHTVGFDESVAHVRSLIGAPVSVTLQGTDPQGWGVVAELTGVLRAVGEDPDDPTPPAEGPQIFGFVDQMNAFYLDPNAFVEGWIWDSYLRVTLTFGMLEIAGPIQRPSWF